ncbi:MAG: hypothetical protein L0Y61_09195 [Epsilonproteobacteria bacterium]|nr:hypothetical protein [Campylobacterota bacterium]
MTKKIAEFDDMIVQVKDELAPYIICRYLLDIAKLFNSYYANTHILKSEEQTKKARIMLLKSLRDTVQKSMNLIGMSFLERM